MYDSGATFVAICCDFPKIATKLHQSATSHPNRTEIAASLHTQFGDATCVRQNLYRKVRQLKKIAQKLHV